MPGTPASRWFTYAALACAWCVQPSRRSIASRPIAACTLGNRSVLRRQRAQRADFFPEEHVGVGVDQRRGPQYGKERDRKHPRLHENPLQPSHQQALGDALFARPRQRLDGRADFRGDRRVGDEREPAAVAVQRLERLEAEERAGPEGADRPPLVERAERVRAVLQHDQVVLPGDREQAIHVAREAVKMRRHDRPRLVRDHPLDGLGIHVERLRIHVREHDRQARDARELRHDPERQRGKDDLGSRRQVERLQHVIEGDAPVRGRDRVRRPEPVPGGERGLEFRNLGALDELAAGLAARDDVLGFWCDSRSVARNGC